jgi:1,4-dihydroxy-2-naphthoyl-CoA hydrolase
MFTYRFRAGLSSTDPAGILFYPELFRHAHDAYEGWMSAMGHGLDIVLAESQVLLPIVHAEADFRAPIRHGEVIAVGLAVKNVGHTSYTLAYTFRSESEDDVRARASTVHVLVDRKTGRARPLPDELRADLLARISHQDSEFPV